MWDVSGSNIKIAIPREGLGVHGDFRVCVLARDMFYLGKVSALPTKVP